MKEKLTAREFSWRLQGYFCASVLSHFSHVQLFATLWTVTCQAFLSMGFSRQEYWSGLPAILQGIIPALGRNPCLLCLLHYRQVL